MNIEWLKLREFSGSVNNAFEELVCQLARAEEFQNKKKFIRVGAPDGGVESYCVLETGMEYGWQAKFFTSMGAAQWQQLALELRRREATEWPTLRDSLAVNETRAFAHNLFTLGQEAHCAPLATYAATLTTFASALAATRFTTLETTSGAIAATVGVC